MESMSYCDVFENSCLDDFHFPDYITEKSADILSGYSDAGFHENDDCLEKSNFDEQLFEALDVQEYINLDEVIINDKGLCNSKTSSWETSSNQSSANESTTKNENSPNTQQTVNASTRSRNASSEISSDDQSSIYRPPKNQQNNKKLNKKLKTEQVPRSHNAIMAKIAREKKKQYIKDLEMDISNLTEENKKIKNENLKMTKTICDLTETVNYLKGVLNNQSILSKIITAVNDEQENVIRFRSCKRSMRNDHSYTQVCTSDDIKVPNKKFKVFNDGSKDTLPPAGVCLHVQDEGFTIEMCSSCNLKANKLLDSKTVSKN